MDSEKLSIYQAQLENILKEILGGVEKSRKPGTDGALAPLPDISDDAAQAYSREVMTNLGEQGWNKLKQVEEALEKIKSGDYGTCTHCEQPIPEVRLKVQPFAEHCVSCLEMIEKNGSPNNFPPEADEKLFD
jgi:DnaK suppressor protein